MEHNCIICIYDDRYEVAGPFVSLKALRVYGEWWQAKNGDRPTWQSIYLADPAVEPTVIRPA